MSDRVNINAEQIKADGAFQNDLSRASSVEDIVRASQALRERAQGVVFDPSSGQYVAASVPSAASATREFTKSVEIGGREFTFTASSEAEMAALISNAQLVAESVAAPVRDENGRFVARNGEPVDDGGAEAARQTELELKFRRGELSIKEYLAESGAVGSYLEDAGVSMEDLRATAQQRDAEIYAHDWQQATQTFLAGPGGDWPGGEANKINLQNALVALDLMDAEDKVGALVTAFDYMKRNNALIPYEQTNSAVQSAINKELETASPEELIRVWREQFSNSGDASAANQALIASFRRKG
jgi:hypothetical protein